MAAAVLAVLLVILFGCMFAADRSSGEAAALP